MKKKYEICDCCCNKKGDIDNHAGSFHGKRNHLNTRQLQLSFKRGYEKGFMRKINTFSRKVNMNKHVESFS